ncbi:MAG TPA: ankyrin repeat domain-containing protein [Bryobacteraceae bacterium]|nr:ankyrin repeat domain-containing protein [Bryobacteraceae bacterium]
MNRSLPTRKLREHPDLDQLKRQAKELLEAFTTGDAAAVAEVNAHYRAASPVTFALHDAQLVLARAYGFDSWPKLRAFVDGVTVKRFEEVARNGDIAQLRVMLKHRPELVNSAALRHAVLRRDDTMVRMLMEHGANARTGVYPHRDATTPLVIATDRGYDEIVVTIKEVERRRRETNSAGLGAPDPEVLFGAIASGENDRAIGLMESEPSLIQARLLHHGWTPLHVAAAKLNVQMVNWLTERGADVNAKGRNWTEQTPLDTAAHSSDANKSAEYAVVANRLVRAGAEMTPWAAVALGDAEWLRARHAQGSLTNPIEGTGGMLRIAASYNRADILQLLLKLGFDPNERTRMEDVDADSIAFTWGMPLYHCAQFGKCELAEILLKHGADPNGKVYASGDPVFQAYDKRDWKMVELLQRYGGVPEATTAGLFRQTELARKMLAGEAKYGSEGVGGDTLAEQLLWGGACGGDAEIVRMALEYIDRPKDDPWWFHIMEQPIRMWSDGGAQLDCLKLILERCDPNILGRSGDGFNLTILHSVAGARPHVTEEERLAFATVLLDAGGRTDLRDGLLNSTALGWACRWGRAELVKLLLERGADPVEAGAESWATPRAWAETMKHDNVLQVLLKYGVQEKKPN